MTTDLSVLVNPRIHLHASMMFPLTQTTMLDTVVTYPVQRRRSNGSPYARVRMQMN